MKLNIPSKLVEFDKIIYDPFCIFEMNNFFENHVYNDLVIISQVKRNLKAFIKMEKKFFSIIDIRIFINL